MSAGTHAMLQRAIPYGRFMLLVTQVCTAIRIQVSLAIRNTETGKTTHR